MMFSKSKVASIKDVTRRSIKALMSNNPKIKKDEVMDTLIESLKECLYDHCSEKSKGKKFLFIEGPNYRKYIGIMKQVLNEFFPERKPSFKRNLPEKGFIYIIQGEFGGPVKIGFSRNPQSRISSIQTGCPFKLKAVKIIPNKTYNDERALHRKFSKYRLHGEWFSEEVIGLVEN